MDAVDFLYFYKIDVKARVSKRFHQKIHKKFKRFVEIYHDRVLNIYNSSDFLSLKLMDMLLCIQKDNPYLLNPSSQPYIPLVWHPRIYILPVLLRF